MLVTLAGMNTPLPAAGGEATPEIICAAYARISRSPRAVHELRARAARDLAHARAFTERIVHHLGHESVAEHAVFNLDILGVSRLVIEMVEHSRLASYTERSQRYVRLGGDFLIPREARDLGLSREFRELCQDQHAAYRAVSGHLAASGSSRAAKEDARYALGLATTTQLGLTANARALMAMVARLEHASLCEAQVLGSRLRRLCTKAAPSLIPPEPIADKVPVAPPLPQGSAPWPAGRSPSLAWHTPEPEFVMRDALRFCGLESWKPPPASGDVPARAALPRTFETVQLAFSSVVSAAAFAQLKRHRMATLLARPYDPSLGITVPPSVEMAGLGPALEALAADAAQMALDIAHAAPEASPYALLNAHRRRVVLIMNARAFHQMACLRLDPHAQWDIRREVLLMTKELWSRLPALAELMGLPAPGPA